MKENELIDEFSGCLHKRSDEMSGMRRQSTYFAKYFFMNGLKLLSPISSGKILFLFIKNNFLVVISIERPNLSISRGSLQTKFQAYTLLCF